MDSNFRFPDAPSGRSAEPRAFPSDREFAPLAWRDRDFERRPLAGWISALERGRFQGYKQKRKLKSVATFARNRKFESISLQRRVDCEPVRFDLSNTRMCGSIPRSWISQFGSDPQQTDRCGSTGTVDLAGLAALAPARGGE